MKKFIVAVLTIAFMLSYSSALASDKNVSDTAGTNMVSEDINTKDSARYVSGEQAKAMEAYQKIWDSFSFDEHGKPIYPDEYGGEYIEGDILYIWLKEPSEQVIKKYEELCDSDNVIFLEAKYSLNQLNKGKAIALSIGKEYHIMGCTTDRKNNKVKIYIADEINVGNNPNDTVMALKCLLGDEMYEYELQKETTLCYSLKAGTGISSNGNSFALGVCGSYNSQPAILTAGHCVSSTGVSICYGSNSTAFATVQIKQFDDEEIGDYAIATINANQQSNYTITNQLISGYPSTAITGTVFNGWAPVGTAVYAYRATTGETVQGTVYETDVTMSAWFTAYLGESHYYIDGLISVDLEGTDTIQSGDSGGPVTMYLNGFGTQLLGTITGSCLIGNTNNRVLYYSPISYAQMAGFVVKVGQ